MKKTEIRELVKGLVSEYPEGVSLTDLHRKVYRLLTRLQLPTLLGALNRTKEINREKVKENKRSITKYFPLKDEPWT